MKKIISVSLTASLILLASSVGCGEDGTKVALLLPGGGAIRDEAAIRPHFERAFKHACKDCGVVYGDADGKLAEQRRQARAALAEGVDVLVVDPIRAEHAAGIVREARAAGVPVLDYDSLILDVAPDLFLSYDAVETGRIQARSLVEALRADGRPKGPVVMLNGEPGNRDEHLFRQGATAALDAAGVRVAREYFTPFWLPREARKEMERAIAALGPSGFAGVYAETDGIAEGALAALRAFGIPPSHVPVTGRDATPRGIRRVVHGTQHMTTYEPTRVEAATAAQLALALAKDEGLPSGRINGHVDNGSAHEVPSVLLEPVAITKANVERTVLASRLSRRPSASARTRSAGKATGSSSAESPRP